MSAAILPVRRLLLALLIVTIWGSNFVAIKLALQDLPPLLLCTLRFVFVAIPAVFFLKRPDVPVRQLLVYGFSMFAFQFGFMFLGMKLGSQPAWPRSSCSSRSSSRSAWQSFS